MTAATEILPAAACVLTPEDARIERIPFSGCWIWTGASNQGYGYITVCGVAVYTHRAMYCRFHGAIPDGLQVLHRCDIPACINPGHLFAGTIRDNVRDCINKGRFNPALGEKNGRAKLRTADVIAIRLSGESSSVLAERYGIGRERVHSARTGRGWKHLPSAEALADMSRAAESSEASHG